MNNAKTLGFIATFAAAITTAPADLLFSDNFDAPDTANFDGAPTAGRLAGSLTGDVVLRSFGFQQDISNNQLLMPTGTNGVRFENNDGTFGADNRYDWAGGAAGAEILARGGFTVSFDWIPAGNTTRDWVSFQVGTINADNGNLTDDDYGILFRQDGDTERFDNSVNMGAGGSFPATPGGLVRHVEITYEFSSFADGETVTATSWVDGLEVASDSFTWDSNGGEMRMELGHNDPNVRIDNLEVNSLDASGFQIELDDAVFLSSLMPGDAVGSLSAAFEGVPETAAFSLVAGAGDADNSKFQIVGDELQLAAGFDFLDEPDGTPYSVRVDGLGDDSGEAGEATFVLTLIADADADTLPDTWELAATDTGGGGNLTDLSGLGGADFDTDMLTDLEEYQLNLAGTAVSPIADDTDMDELKDGEEVAGAGARPPTDPTNPDTDGDALTDGQESNSGTFADADDTGTDPTLGDTDSDEYRDGFEVLRGGDPTDGGHIPPLDPAVSLVVLTDDASSGIDAANTYTHAVSGGGAATVNGVSFETMTPAVIPANITWDTGGFTMNEVAAINNGDWLPANGGVTGPGLLDLFGGFTYSGDGANSGSAQTYTLTGLTAGQSYTLRLYVRLWDTEGSGRPLDLSFDNGGQITRAPILEDRPAAVLGGAALGHEAYAIEFRYVAAGSDLIIHAPIPAGGLVPSGSYHLYGLTNEESGAAPAPVVTAISRDSGTGEVTITFESTPGAEYGVDFSTTLNPAGQPGGWQELNDAVPSDGTSTTFVDTVAAPSNPPTLLYRIRPAE